MKYFNFAVELAALPDGRYRITLTSPVGEATTDVSSPFTDAEIAETLAILGREKMGVTREQIAATARQFGDKLFNFLFRATPEINNAYFASLARAGSDGLRIRLSVDRAGALSHLPWELLRDPNREFLTLSRSTPVVRYTQQLSIRPPAAITQPLRVLVMISSPKDFPPLDVEGEWKRLQESTAELVQKGMIQLERMDDATLIGLQRRLRTGDYHIFHFIGHSDFDAANNQGVLIFESMTDSNKGQVISGGALARELGEESSIRLVILNSCRSARRVEQDVFAGIASSLVARGIPAVVAMQFEISDRAAKVFAEEFYRAISDLLPIDTALSEARRAIANVVQNTEWATPVLYMRSESGVLFETQERTVVTPVSEPPPGNRALQIVLLALVAIVVLGAIVALVVTVDNQNRASANATGTAVVVALQTQNAAQTLTAQPTITPTPTINPALLPDLQITRYRIAPETIAPGAFFRVIFTITNTGNIASGAFNWSWDADLAGDRALQDTVSGSVDNILPGSSRSVSFSFLYGWWGTYTTQVQVDVDEDVRESNNRNNELIFDVVVQNQPFGIDFTVLPDTTVVEPPFTLGADEFTPWNLLFNLGATASDPCFATPLQLIDIDGDITLASDGANDACLDSPLSITITRRFISDAQIFVLPIEPGEATVAYFAQANDTEPFFVTPPLALTPGEAVALGGIGASGNEIRRIEVRMNGQPVHVTRLVLQPPPTAP